MHRRGAAITLGAVALGLTTAACSGGGSSGGSSPPACSAEGSINNPAATPASGSVEGPSVSASICSGGAFAYMESTVSSYAQPYLLTIMSALSGNSASFNDVTKPPGSQEATLSVLVGVNSPSPGTYSSSNGGCGEAAFCVYFPIPSTLDCDAGSSTSCPPGCSLQGPGTGPSCMPNTPEVCYSSQSQSSRSCEVTNMPAMGSWTATLTSVEPYQGPSGRLTYYVVHGTYTTSMGPGEPSSPDAGMATMTLSF